MAKINILKCIREDEASYFIIEQRGRLGKWDI